MTNSITDVLDQNEHLLHKIRDAQERYILAFFGSEEAAKQNAHLYVFEEKTELIFEHDTNTYRAVSEYHLRKKTEKELAEIT